MKRHAVGEQRVDAVFADEANPISGHRQRREALQIVAVARGDVVEVADGLSSSGRRQAPSAILEPPERGVLVFAIREHHEVDVAIAAPAEVHPQLE